VEVQQHAASLLALEQQKHLELQRKLEQIMLA
jgi:hypothetical protein